MVLRRLTRSTATSSFPNTAEDGIIGTDVVHVPESGNTGIDTLITSPATVISTGTVTFGSTTVFNESTGDNSTNSVSGTGTTIPQLPQITSRTSGNSGSPTTSQQQQQQDLAGIFSIIFNRRQSRFSTGMPHCPSTTTTSNSNPFSSFMMNTGYGGTFGSRIWPTFSMSSGGGGTNRSLWTKYCLLCTICGSAATILAGIFLIIAVLFRYYTTSIYYFETVPTYIPAILLSICGISTIAFSCKRNRNITLLRITACWSLVSAALSSVITITTSLIHMNRLQTLKECVYNKSPPSCTCFGHSYGLESVVGGYSTNGGNGGSLISANGDIGNDEIIGGNGNEPLHFVFENTIDCDVIHGVLYSCLRAVFAISVVAVLLSIFLCMLLYQLIGHERKKAYWSRIRRINSDWSSDFLACLPRNLPRERSGLMPLVLSPSATLGLGTTDPILHHIPSTWGPPPPYEPAASTSSIHEDLQPPVRRTTLNAAPLFTPRSYVTAMTNSASQHSFIALPPAPTVSGSFTSLLGTSSHPFSPTITSLAPSTSSSSTLGTGLPNKATTTATGLASSSTGFPTSFSAGNIQAYTRPDTYRNFEERQEFAQQQQQLKIDRRMNLVPKLQPGTSFLRESKISISSDSDNLYSIDEDLFKDPNREKELEMKINNQIISLLLAAEREDFDRKVHLADKTDSNCSSLVTLQNDDENDNCNSNNITCDANGLPSKNSIVNIGVGSSKTNSHLESKSGRVISSLPASPFLSNVKKYFRQRTNSLRLLGSPQRLRSNGRRKHSFQYTEFDTGKTETDTTKSIVEAVREKSSSVDDCSNTHKYHVNPNYSPDNAEIWDHSPLKYSANTMTISTKVAEVLLTSTSKVGNSNTNAGKSPVNCLKSRSLPGSPLRRKVTVAVKRL